MKRANSASITATFVCAILSLILPASALADATVRPLVDPPPDRQPSVERSQADALRDDPILKSTWGPGDPDLAVSKFHFTLKAKSPPANAKAGGIHAASADPLEKEFP
jgi:hypothetical protein